MATTQTSANLLRSTLRGAEDTIFDLVCSKTTLEQWVEWLRTPLECAIAAGNVILLKKLQAAGARAHTVHPAVRSGQGALVLELLRQGASPSEPDENGDAPLHVAVQIGHVDILSLLLRQGATVDALDKEGRSPLHLAAGAAGSLALVQTLVSGGADLSLRHGSDGKSALGWATFHGRVDVMRSLIQHGVDVNVASEATHFTALHVAARSNQVGAIDVLIEAGAGIDYTGGGNKETPLHVATRLGLSEGVVALLRHGADTDKLDWDGRSALHVAAEGGSAAIVEVLLAAGAKPNIREGKNDSTALGLAIEEGHADVAEALIKHGASLNAVNKNGSTALHVATSALATFDDAVAVVDVLIAAGADVDAQEGEKQERPLHVATRLQDPELVVALLGHGADAETRDGAGCSALHVAATEGNAAIVEALLAAGAKPNLRERITESTALGLAAERGHAGVVEALIKYGASLNASDKYGCTPLLVATDNNEFPVIKMLLAAGARVGVKGKDGRTPLHVASAGGFHGEDCPETIAALMKYGAGSIAFAANGQAPLHLAIENGHVGAVTALLVAGADANLRTKSGKPALCVAASWEQMDVLNVLIQHGADVKAFGNGESGTALHAAALSRIPAGAIDALIAGGADLEAENGEGGTPLLSASRWGSSEVFLALLKHGANAAKRDVEGRGIIHKAAQRDDVAVMKAVLASGADTDLRDYEGHSALHLVDSSCPAMVEALLEHGADLEARDSTSCTALHQAASSSDSGAFSIDALISDGAATEARNEKGQTPLHVASQDFNNSAMRALLRSGADLHAKDGDGLSPLQVVVTSGDEYDQHSIAKSVDLLLRWGADETATAVPPSYNSDDSDDNARAETASGLWEQTIRTLDVSAEEVAPVRKLLADTQKDRVWRRQGWLVLVRAFPDRVQLKAESKSTAITGRARSVRARGVAAAASGGAQAVTTAPPHARTVRGLSSLVARVVTFEEEGVFRNIVKFL